MIIFELRKKKGKRIKFQSLMEKINLKKIFKYLRKNEEKFVNKFPVSCLWSTDNDFRFHFASRALYGAFYRRQSANVCLRQLQES